MEASCSSDEPNLKHLKSGDVENDGGGVMVMMMIPWWWWSRAETAGGGEETASDGLAGGGLLENFNGDVENELVCVGDFVSFLFGSLVIGEILFCDLLLWILCVGGWFGECIVVCVVVRRFGGCDVVWWLLEKGGEGDLELLEIVWCGVLWRNGGIGFFWEELREFFCCSSTLWREEFVGDYVCLWTHIPTKHHLDLEIFCCMELWDGEFLVSGKTEKLSGMSFHVKLLYSPSRENVI
ncbi:hypothetical protein Tco_0490342 [Tanacetum coccineum]